MKDSKKRKRHHSSRSHSSSNSHDRKKKKAKKVKEENSIQDNVKMISEYRKLLEQNNQTQLQSIPGMNPYFTPFTPLSMPPKVQTQAQVVIQNPKYSANKSHKEYQPFYIPAPQDDPKQKNEKNEIKRENLDNLIVFKKNFQEIIPQGVYQFKNLFLNCDLVDPNLLIQVSKKYLQDFEKIFKNIKGFEKKRIQLVKAIKGIQEITRKIQDKKRLKSAHEEQKKFDLIDELDKGLSLDIAAHFLDFEKYGLSLSQDYSIIQESNEGKQLFEQCLKLIE